MLKSLVALPFALALAGCAVAPGTQAPVHVASVSAAVSGNVHGGQQPVSGAVIQLYAAGTKGYGGQAIPLIATTVTTDAQGGFLITSDYTCPAGAMVYLTATGGNPGLAAGTNNAALALMTALGPCSNLSSSSLINVNELTTVASVWALSRFLSDVPQMSTSATNTAGLSNAFAVVNELVDTRSGTMPGPALPALATLPVAELNTLADIVSACVNTAGGVANDGSPCGNLLAAATPAGGSAPTNTIAAAATIARSPAANVAALFALSTSNAPFQPTLGVAPNNFLVGIRYAGGGLAAPRALALDPSGNVWLANTAASTLTELAPSGAAISPAGGFTGGGLNLPVALAADVNGGVWIANGGTNTVSRFAAAGAPVAGSPYSGGGLNAPSSIALDTTGNAWVTNRGNSTLSAFSPGGAALSPASGYSGAGLNQPVSITINPQ